MSVIIRLQNLPWSANSLDIRHYFRGLSIPEGGVHIVGGEMGDAFIAFSTDEDARQAMMLAGGKIKEVQISLMLSSRSEMQKIIEAARQASMSNSLAQLLAPSAVPVVPAVSAVTMPAITPQSVMPKERRESKGDKKDSSDLSSSSHDTGRSDRRDRRDKSRSRSRDRNRRDRRDRDRDRDRDRRRRSRSRSRSRDRRRRRSRSRSRGRDVHSRDRDRKDMKDDGRKDDKVNQSQPTLEPGTTLPNLEILNPNTWNVMQTGTALAQNAQLLSNFELLRNLANQKGPLLHGGPTPLLQQAQMNNENEGNSGMFQNRGGSPSQGDFSNRGSDFGGRGKGDGGRGGNQRGFKNFDDKPFGNQDNNNFGGGGGGGGDGRFDRNRGQNNYQNFGSGFPMRNGNEQMNNPRFGGNMMGRNDNGFMPRGPTGNRERPNGPRGLLDMSGPGTNQRDRFSNRDDRVDEFGRSIQLRNRKNAASDDSYKEDNSSRTGGGGGSGGSGSGGGNGNGSGGGGADQQNNFQGFQNRYGKNQQNQGRPPHMMRGRDNWQGGRNSDGFQSDRRNFRGSFDDSGRGFRSRSREFSGRNHDDSDGKFIDKDCCVEIRNLSPQIAYGDVRRPFSNLKLIIKEIKFLDYGHNVKKCRIRFLNNENKKKAIQCSNSNKIVVDNKQVHLLHITDNEFEESVDEGVKRPELKFSDDEEDATLSAKDVYVEVKDLPFTAEENDVADLFPNMPLEKILMEESSDGKSKGAFVKFQKAVDAKVALGTPTRTLGEVTVTLSPLPQYAFNDRLAKSGKGEGDVPDVMEVDQTSAECPDDKDKTASCVLMKNLPLEANDRDICDFFSDIGLVPNKIHLMLDMAGQPSGDAFIEFSDSQQIERACSKNSAHLGKNIVAVSQVPRSEMLEALGVSQPESNNKIPGLMDNFGRPQCVVALENIPFRARNFDILGFFGWSYNLTEKDVLRRYNDKGQPTGDGKVCFNSPEDALRAIRFLNNRSLMGRVIRMKLV